MGLARAAALALAIVLVLVLPATAAAPVPKTGAWSGKTSQSRAIEFKVFAKGTKLKRLEFGVVGRCPSGQQTGGTISYPDPITISKKGKFRMGTYGGAVLKGRFTTKKKAKGTLEWRGARYPEVGDPEPCSSGNVTWTAKR
jgi:hypothetical protein